MTQGEYVDTLIGFGHVATSGGLSDQEQAFALLLTALGVTDRNSPGGCSRETFVQMATLVHDRARGALAAGVRN